MVWMLNLTEKYPKNERFRLAKRIDDAMLNFYEQLIKATRRTLTNQALFEADIELEKLRLFLRISHQQKLLTDNQYQFVSRALVEIGRLLGGWIKSTRDSETRTFVPT